MSERRKEGHGYVSHAFYRASLCRLLGRRCAPEFSQRGPPDVSECPFHPTLGADLYNTYLDEYEYAEEVGFDGLMLNEHHNTPSCMGAAMNLEAAILARTTKRAKIVLLGNPLPIFDNPLRLAEELAGD